MAILPFQNLGGDASTDYLRLALPDEIATTLSYIPTLAIRPFASTQKYAKGDVDPQAAGRELRVADVLTGHFQKEGDQLRVTLEVVDTESNRLLWRDTSSSASNDLIGLRDQISRRLRDGLFPLLGGGAAAGEASTRPKNAEAYDLYLRSKPLTSDNEPNKQGIAMLERSVGLDPGYAPAWSALALRYYYDASYGTSLGSDERRIASSAAAYERSLSLDPNFTEAAQGLIVFATEGGDLHEADAKARDILRRRPRDPQAHFAMAYVLRYAGLLEESAKECDAALALDPRNAGFRSCLFVFLQLNQYGRARDYLRLDAGSGWARGREGNILIREGKIEAAADRFRNEFPALAALILKSGAVADRDRTAATIEARAMADRDPEDKYYFASFLAFGGYRDGALRLLRKAVEGNYLGYPAMDNDPLFDSIRKDARFAAIRAEAIRRQKEFVARRAAVPGG
jgi:TolB-like protein